MDARTLLLTAALRHRISEPNVEAGYERLVALTEGAPTFNEFCDAVASCLREGLIREPIRLPEGALQCHWHLELTPKGVAAARLRKGGCYCGAIRYRVTGAPFNATNCHCSICRRTTGAPFVTWFSVRPDEFQITQGQPAKFASSPSGTRTFCARCGTQLTFRQAGRNEIDITTCSLDQPELVPPEDNTRTSCRLSWIGPDGLPDHPEARGD